MPLNPQTIELFDTTLRDGSQTAGINFSLEDKVRIAERLADFQLGWIEGGWPGASPKDTEFFERMRQRQWTKTKLIAFGSMARPGKSASEDLGLRHLVDSGADGVCVFGKSWDLHVNKALGISLPENLDLIQDTISWLKEQLPTVFFDAEHFFDGYRDNPEYALEVLKAAQSAGADGLVLCDTNGGSIPSQVAATVADVVRHCPGILIGIHAHNDSELAVANSVAATEAGARMVQGTINGIGERCGNANLVSIIPILQLKMGLDCGVDRERLKQLSSLSRFVNEMANRQPWPYQPFVGHNAFAHKGGIHASAVQKESRLYEHLDPEQVGNDRLILISDQAGKSSVQLKMAEMGFDVAQDANDPAIRTAINRVKELENRGFAYEGAEASFQLLLLKAMKRFAPYFELKEFRVIDERHGDQDAPMSEVSVTLRVGEEITSTSARGNGPVNAMDNALREALLPFYPGLASMRLTDFKVRVLTTNQATRATVRVLIESTDGHAEWGTVGVSANMVDASYQALADAIQFKLMIDKTAPHQG
ncbi:MAG: citramalate synthase [Gammaproteobacteria bacterium]|nr:citramalate synthase [Gammaproteobacteria bacterium]NBY23337.1 citramalate synthase [Gammaproteobacteria bacterium]